MKRSKEETKKRNAELRRLRKEGKPTGVGGKKKVKLPGFSVMVETFDKSETKCICVTIKAHTKHLGTKTANRVVIGDIEYYLKRWFNDWVKAQPEYDNRYICVVECGNGSASYTGLTKTLSVELTLKHKEATNFQKALEIFTPKIDGVCGSLKTLLEENGLELKDFRGYLSDEYK